MQDSNGKRMTERKKIFAIVGSASKHSANQKLVMHLAALTKDDLEFTVCNDLKTLPHFDPELSADSPPKEIIALRNEIEKADGVLICTPEYVYSIPSGLKNAIEWCIATTVFTAKPAGLITAAAGGEKAHEELQLIMKTAMCSFTTGTTLLIRGIRGKINEVGEIIDAGTANDLIKFIEAFKNLVADSG